MLDRPDERSSLACWLSYQEQLHTQAIDMGLDRVLIVLRKMLCEQVTAKIITVGGTNGKGSTVAALEALLLRAGKRVGAYTSPHIHRYNERVRIQGVDVDDAHIVEAFAAVEQFRGTTALTYFEFGTLAAIWLMQAADLDYWVMEVGLGGRLDAVNVLDPDLAIITSVDLDHMDWLGTDRDSIGYEKAGILRPGITAVYGEADIPHSVLMQASAQQVNLLVAGSAFGLTDDGKGWVTDREGQRAPFDFSVEAKMPVASLLNAMQVMVAAGFPLASIVRDASLLADELVVPGRFETLSLHPQVIADVGHNPHAARWLAHRVDNLPVMGRLRVVYAALADKDVRGVVAALGDRAAQWYLAGLDVPRGLSSAELHGRVADLLPGASCFLSVNEALACALREAEKEDVIFVFGSFYTVAVAREYSDYP